MADERTVSKGTRESLSQFAARVLDQLRISAWLPATLLVAGSYLILLAEAEGAVGSRMVAALASMRWETILLLVLATTVAATLTQGFAFNLIRILEGYWGRLVLRSPLGKLAVWAQARRRDRLKDRHAKLIDRAMQGAHQTMLEDPDIGAAVASVVIAQACGQPTDDFPASVLKRAARQRWLDHAPAHVLNEAGAVRLRFLEYPAPSRLLPTRLGNIMRAAEDRAFPNDPRVRTATLRIIDEIPAALAIQLRNHRDELDLYATNLVVVAGLAILSGALLYPFVETLVFTLVLSGATIIANYLALLASARAWGDLTVESARTVGKPDPDAPGSIRP